MGEQQRHFVLVHGLCHGAWCWFKLIPLLRAAGHRVTALDLSASGTNTQIIQDIHTLAQYTKPLLDFMAALPAEEKVILVGHSLGGFSLALAADEYPEKISLNVFLAGLMPDVTHAPSYILDKYMESVPPDHFLDTQFIPYGEDGSETAVLFGPMFLSTFLYQLCSIEDLELAKILIRPGSFFLNDLSTAQPFSEEGYGSVGRVFIKGDEDKTFPPEYLQWMLDNYPVMEVKELTHVDHMSMLSDPNQVCASLLEIALEYP